MELVSQAKELPVLPKQLPFGDLEALPLPDDISPDKRKLDGGYMVVTPPRVIVSAAIKSGQPVTRRRVALVEISPYLNKEQAQAYAQAIAALPELIQVCQAAMAIKVNNKFAVRDLAEKALAKAGILA